MNSYGKYVCNECGDKAFTYLNNKTLICCDGCGAIYKIK